MASRKKAESPRRVGHVVRRLVSGAALVGLGACIGVVVGTVWKVPEMLVQRLREVPRRVDLAGPESQLPVAELPEFAALQDSSPTGKKAASQPKQPKTVSRAQPREKAVAQPTQPSPSTPPVAARPSRESGPPPRKEKAPVPAPAAAKVAKAPVDPPPSVKSSREVIDQIRKSSAESTTEQGAERTGPLQVVQIAAYTDRRSAEALVRRLSADGLDPFVSDTQPRGEVRYRVRVRPRPGQQIESLADELKSRGFSVWIASE
jgi:cell division septation protein DedD